MTFNELNDEHMFGNNVYAQYYQFEEEELLGDSLDGGSSGATLLGTGIIASWVDQDRKDHKAIAVRLGEERARAML